MKLNINKISCILCSMWQKSLTERGERGYIINFLKKNRLKYFTTVKPLIAGVLRSRVS